MIDAVRFCIYPLLIIIVVFMLVKGCTHSIEVINRDNCDKPTLNEIYKRDRIDNER